MHMLQLPPPSELLFSVLMFLLLPFLPLFLYFSSIYSSFFNCQLKIGRFLKKILQELRRQRQRQTSANSAICSSMLPLPFVSLFLPLKPEPTTTTHIYMEHNYQYYLVPISPPHPVQLQLHAFMFLIPTILYFHQNTILPPLLLLFCFLPFTFFL